MTEQGWLFPYPNPLKHRLPPEFWESIPQAPGVYLMRGAEDQVLYVGKAKNLRTRLLSYRRARPHAVSRKIVRLVHLIRRIDWELTPDEGSALLRENELLRELDPPFNSVNTRPDTYLFIALKNSGPEIRFRLTTTGASRGDLLYGAFKGRRQVERSFGALLRLVWATRAQDPRWEFPARLTRYRPPPVCTLPVPEGENWFRDFKRFLEGRDSGLIHRLTDALLGNERIPRFVYGMIQEDLQTVSEFHDAQLVRHRALRKKYGLRGRLIAQEKIDDLLALELLQRRQQRLEQPGLSFDPASDAKAPGRASDRTAKRPPSPGRPPAPES